MKKSPNRVKTEYRRHLRSFTVLPRDTNHMEGVIFGGKFLEEIDITCAELCRRALYQSETANKAFTYRINELEFTAPAKQGDIVFIDAKLSKLKRKAMVVRFSAFIEQSETGTTKHVAHGELVFVSHFNGDYKAHGLEL